MSTASRRGPRCPTRWWSNPNPNLNPNPNPTPNPNPNQEIAGTGVVPHDAIGNARVLTVEKAEDQAKVMIEVVENQSP